MSDHPPVSGDVDCQQSQQHDGHLCRLIEQGRMAEVLAHSAHPTCRCRNCGAVADRAEALCRPGEL